MIYQDKSQIYAQKWEEIKEVLREVPSVEETTKMLEEAGLPVEDFYKMYSKEKLADAVKYAKDLKDRYTVLWLYDNLKKY